MSALSANLTVAAAVLLAGISLVLAVLGLASYQRVRHARLLWVALAFAAFCGKGIYLAIRAYAERGALATSGLEGLLPTVVLADLAIVLMLYLSAWKP